MNNREFSKRGAISAFMDRFRHGDEDVSTKIMERSTEAAIAFYAFVAAFEAGQANLVTVDAFALDKYSGDQAQLRASREAITNSSLGLNELAASLNTLDAVWYDNYRKSRTVFKTRQVRSCDANGDNCTSRTEFYTEVEHYWDEPAQWTALGLNHSTIDAWVEIVNTQLANANRALQELPNTPTFEDGLNTYRVTEKPIDKTARNGITTIGFTAAATGFAFYEEIVSALAKYYDGFDSDAILNKLSQVNIKRRSIFKVITGSLSIDSISQWSREYADKNSGAKSALETQIKAILTEMKIDNREAISVLFGLKIEDINSNHSSIHTILSHALDTENNGIEDFNQIKPLLENLAVQNANRLSHLMNQVSDLNQPTLDANLVTTALHLKTDRQVQSLATEQKIQAVLNSIVQVVLLFTAFAGIAITQETAFVVADAVYEKMNT